jgi:hypothetical protein
LNNHWFELGIGAFLLIGGIVGVIKKRFSFGLGPARGGSASPNFTVTLTESRAVFFSRLCVVEGAIVIALWFIAYSGDKVLTRWIGAVAGAALIIALLTFGICAFFEVTEPLIAKDKTGKKKKRSE